MKCGDIIIWRSITKGEIPVIIIDIENNSFKVQDENGIYWCALKEDCRHVIGENDGNDKTENE